MSLPPYTPKLGPQSYQTGLYSDDTEIVMLHKNLLSRTSLDTTIKTIRGREICHVSSPNATKQKLFTSVNGQADLFLLNAKSASVSDYHGKSYTGNDFTSHTHFKLINPKTTVTFQNAADDKQYDLKVHGDWLSDTMQIWNAQHLIAEITRAPFYGMQASGVNAEPSVFVKVAAQVDLSLMAAIAMCLEDRQFEKDSAMKMHRFGG